MNIAKASINNNFNEGVHSANSPILFNTQLNSFSNWIEHHIIKNQPSLSQEDTNLCIIMSQDLKRLSKESDLGLKEKKEVFIEAAQYLLTNLNSDYIKDHIDDYISQKFTKTYKEFRLEVIKQSLQELNNFFDPIIKEEQNTEQQYVCNVKKARFYIPDDALPKKVPSEANTELKQHINKEGNRKALEIFKYVDQTNDGYGFMKQNFLTKHKAFEVKLSQEFEEILAEFIKIHNKQNSHANLKREQFIFVTEDHYTNEINKTSNGIYEYPIDLIAIKVPKNYQEFKLLLTSLHEAEHDTQESIVSLNSSDIAMGPETYDNNGFLIGEAMNEINAEIKSKKTAFDSGLKINSISYSKFVGLATYIFSKSSLGELTKRGYHDENGVVDEQLIQKTCQIKFDTFMSLINRASNINGYEGLKDILTRTELFHQKDLEGDNQNARKIFNNLVGDPITIIEHNGDKYEINKLAGLTEAEADTLIYLNLSQDSMKHSIDKLEQINPSKYNDLAETMKDINESYIGMLNYLIPDFCYDTNYYRLHPEELDSAQSQAS